MLKNLHIENIAVIERADVDFYAGLNVLTGETGAGKSILIDSIDAVLGGRTSRDLVRSGAESALVTASFDAENTEEWCRENGIEPEEGELLLMRRISTDGRTSARVNGVPVAAAQLKELGSLLLDIHGQNDGRQLLDERRHMAYLDRFGVSEDILSAYQKSYQAYSELLRETKRLQMDGEEKLRLEESLRYRIQELEKAELRSGEEEELAERRDLLRNAEKLTEQLRDAAAALSENDDSAINLCSQSEYDLDRASAWSTDLAEAAELIRTARYSLEDAAERVRDKLAELDFSEEEYDRLEERLSLLRRLEKKYSSDEDGLISLLEESKARLDELEYASDRLIKLNKETEAARNAVLRQGEMLREARIEAGKRLEELVTKELRELNMPSVRFLTEIMPRKNDEPDANGLDDVRFIMSANAGEAPGAISKIASGGELSRIMLALKNVFAARDAVSSLIFDEIDTGVSGMAAQKVAEKLAQLSRRKQVLCITHLSQLAAMADEQYLVEKNERNGRTYTDVRRLDRNGRRGELARINGGGVFTDTLMKSAEELLANAEKYKASLE